MQKCAVKTAQDKTMTLKKFTTQQNEHHIAPLTHIPKCRKRASNTMRAVTPSGAGGARERCESFKKMTTHLSTKARSHPFRGRG